MYRAILTACSAAFLVVSGVVHGLWTDRWTQDSEQIRVAAEKLALVPTTIGKWEGSDIQADNDPRLGLAGVLARRYVHQENGKVVTVYLACGRAGPVCIHAPNACYIADGYAETESPHRVRVAGSGDPAAEFWTARYQRKRSDGESNLRIYWSWHDAKSWQVADNPRVAFAGEPVMHKLYVLRELSRATEPADGDICTEFMQELLPVLEQSLFAK
jgi:hypothetical protein